MQILDVEQGTPEWLEARLGIPTASRFKDIITPARGERSKTSLTYMNELLAERLTGEPTNTFTNEWMERGNELEDTARESYAFISDCEVLQVGIMLNDEGSIGASPDGLIGDVGGLEIKCPKASTVVKYMLDDDLPTIYKPQVQGNLWISGREYWDFVAYHPKMDLFIKRIYRDEEYIQRMAKNITQFVSELEEKYMRLKS